MNESDPCSNVHYCPSTAHYCEDHFHSHAILLADERVEEKEKLLLRACSQPRRREFCYSSSLQFEVRKIPDLSLRQVFLVLTICSLIYPALLPK